jgi:hypothetical protein
VTGVLARAAALLAVLLGAHLAWETAQMIDGGGISGEARVVVEVLNGCGRSGIGERVCALLSDQNFDVMFVGNAEDFGYDRTLVVDRIGDPSKAKAIVDALGLGQVISQVNASSYVEATVVVGSDLAASLALLGRR